MKKIFLITLSLISLCQLASAKTINASPKDSSILFQINHNQGYTVGYFNNFTADVEIDETTSAVSSAKAKVVIDSLYTRNPIRDEGLKSATFFDGAKFPEATFESTTVEGNQVNGNLTIKGVTKPATFTVEQKAGTIVLSGSFNRQDYGITYNRNLANKKKAIGDVVDLIIELKM